MLMCHVLHVPTALPCSVCDTPQCVIPPLSETLVISCMSPTVYMPFNVFPAPGKKHNFCPRTCTPLTLLDNLQPIFQK